MTSKCVLVTGGAGFIGSHLCKALLEKGHDVKIFDSFDPQVHRGPRHPDLGDISLIEGDIRDTSTVRRALRDVEVVFHQCAAVGVTQSMFQIRKYVDVNSIGTATLLDLLANENHDVEKLVVASSNTIYGEGRYSCQDCGPVSPGMRPLSQLRKREWDLRCPHCGSIVNSLPTDEEKPLSPTTVYAVTKRDQEELCLQVGKAYGIPVVALRYFNVIGPGQSLANPYTGVCAIFSSRIRKGNPPVVYEDGMQTRDLVSVHDVVQANLLAMRTDSMNFQSFNVGSGVATSILEIAEKLISLHGSDVEPCIPGKFRAGDIRHCYADISKISSHGYSPTVMSDEAIREFYEWSKDMNFEDRFEEAETEMHSRGLIE